jgi:glycosyltransferase involved in cell wall biosynthesis
MSDGQLWWAYRLARLTVFPSLGEGFGLPVAESLYAGTPVVTSDFGSMAELASLGGCVLVDPRDDTSIAAGIRSLLVDEPLHARLAAEASTIRPRSWADYADELWHAMVN